MSWLKRTWTSLLARAAFATVRGRSSIVNSKACDVPRLARPVLDARGEFVQQSRGRPRFVQGVRSLVEFAAEFVNRAPGHVAQDQFDHTPEVRAVFGDIDDFAAVVLGQAQMEPPHQVGFSCARLADDGQEQQAWVWHQEVLE